MGFGWTNKNISNSRLTDTLWSETATSHKAGTASLTPICMHVKISAHVVQLQSVSTNHTAYRKPKV